MLKPVFLATALSLTAIPGTASAWLASNGLAVQPTGSTSFEVPYRGKSGQRDFWCAAADYVRTKLNLSPETRIYRTSSPPRRAGQGISFSLSPEGAKHPGLLILGKNRGVTAAHAGQFCGQGRDRF